MAQIIKRGNNYFLDYHDGTRRIIRKHGPDKAAAQRTLNALLVEAGERKFLGEAAPPWPWQSWWGSEWSAADTGRGATEGQWPRGKGKGLGTALDRLGLVQAVARRHGAFHVFGQVGEQEALEDGAVGGCGHQLLEQGLGA
jgi:hypothetical protein